MKTTCKLLLTALLIFSAGQLSAQKERSDNVIFTATEQDARFPGGEKAMLQFLADNVVYPKIASQSAIEGMVYVEFVINKDGSISGAKVVRDIGGGCGQSVINAVNKMPNWEPARNNGKAVRAYYTLPASFMPPEEEKSKKEKRKEKRKARKNK